MEKAVSVKGEEINENQTDHCAPMRPQNMQLIYTT